MNGITVTLRTHYPCHPARKVRLSATAWSPFERYERCCPTCEKTWEIQRRTLIQDQARPTEARIDELTWERVAHVR